MNEKTKLYFKNLIPTIYICSFILFLLVGDILHIYNDFSISSFSIGIALLGTIGLVIFKVKRKLFNIDDNIFNKFIFILVVLAFVSLVFSVNFNVALLGSPGRNEGFLQIITYYIIFLNCKDLNNKKSKNIILSLILFTGIMQATYAIMQFYKVDSILFIPILKNAWYSTGLEVNPNFLGSVMVINLSISLGLFFSRNELKYSILGFLLVNLFFLGLLTSGTMSAVVALAVLVIFIIFLIIVMNFNLKTTILKSIILVISCIFIFNNFSYNNNGHFAREIKRTSNEMVSVSKGDIKDSYGTGRIHIWRETLKIVPKYIFTGAGIDNFYYAFEDEHLIDIKSGLYVDKAHNEYLQKLVTEGIFSLLAYLSLLFTIFYLSIKKIFKEKNSKDYIFICLFLSFIGYSVQAFFNISIISVAPLYYVVLGLLSSELKPNKDYKLGSRLSISEIQDLQYDMLNNFDSFCKKNNIKYFLGCGTLAGAILRKDFFPWDDDIDIIMPRVEYEKFINSYSDNNELILLTPNNKDYYCPYAKLVNSNTIAFECKNHIKDYGVFIDIFPIDGAPSKTYLNFVKILKMLNMSKWGCYLEKRNIFEKVLYKTASIFTYIFPNNFFAKLVDRICKKHSMEECNKAGIVCHYKYDREIMDSDIFKKTVIVNFRDKKYPAPKEYKKYLNNLYVDYTKEEEKKPHKNFYAYWK